MAIWHFRLILVPEVILRERCEGVPETIQTELADFPWWSEIQPPEGIEKWFDSLLPPLEPWSEMRRWGFEDSHQAHVIYTNGNPTAIEEIGFAIDARSVSEKLIEAYCGIALQFECVFLTARLGPQQEILRPSKSDILRALNASTAARFLTDPVTTLKSLDGPSITVWVDHKNKI